VKQVIIHWLLLVAISGAIFTTHLGTARLWDRDEPRNAGCAAEMLARGDWVVPMFNDELRPQKPILLYWLIMSAYGLLGQTEFAARIWSAVLAMGTGLATFGIGRGLFWPVVGLIAGVILSTNLMFTVAARAATPDSVLIFCGTMAIWFYVVGTFAQREGHEPLKLKVAEQWFPNHGFMVALFYAMLGLGVLAKGPVGFLLPMAMVGLFLLIQRHRDFFSTMVTGGGPTGGSYAHTPRTLSRWLPLYPLYFCKYFSKTLWSMRPIMGVAIVLLIAAPWYWLVDARTEGDFTRLFFWGEHFGRATMALEGHRGGIWFYPVAILVGFFPWSIFWGPVLIGLIIERRQTGTLGTAQLFFLCWIGIQVVAFTMVQTKLPSYVTPCYPALAILTSVCLAKWAAGESAVPSIWFGLAWVGLSLGGMLASAGLGYAAYEFFPEHVWLVVVGLIPIVGGIVAIWNCCRLRRRQALLATLMSAAMFCFLLFGFGTVAIDSTQQAALVLDPIASAEGQPLVAAYRTLESSWVYYGKRPIYECSWEPAQGIPASLEREKWWSAKPRLTPELLLQADPDTIFLTTDEHLAELRQRLPDQFEILQTSKYFLKKKHLLALRRVSGSGQSGRQVGASPVENQNSQAEQGILDHETVIVR
jgi:4-amino-4-deoxy-L-arabinose transferase-like glycosyltransferase